MGFAELHLYVVLPFLPCAFRLNEALFLGDLLFAQSQTFEGKNEAN